MEIRELQEEDWEQASYIGRQAFAHGRRTGGNWFQDPNRPPITMIGAWDEAGLQARLTIIAYQVYMGPDLVLPMGGIGGVSCLPASRGKGYAGELLKVALQKMYEAGQTLSSLYPFSWDFYRHYGWEWVGLNRTYTVPTRILKPCSETEHVRAVRPEDRPKIEAIYARYAANYRGMVVRDAKEWNAVLQDRDDHYTYTYLYENLDGSGESQPEGYFTYSGGKREETRIREFIASTSRARRALLGLLRRHEMQVEKFRWDAPGDDLLYHQLCHNDTETKLEPMVQGRIVDVARALTAWHPAPEARGAFDLSVQDEHASWNQGTWHVEFEAGNVSVRRSDAEAQIALTIQSLSQAYYGTPTLDEIRAAEKLTVHDETAYASLRTLLAGPPMWTVTHF